MGFWKSGLNPIVQTRKGPIADIFHQVAILDQIPVRGSADGPQLHDEMDQHHAKRDRNKNETRDVQFT